MVLFCAAPRLSAAVHEILLPIMKEIKNDLNSVKDDLNSVKNDLNSFNETVSLLNKTVSSLSGDLEDYKQQTSSQLSSLQNTHNWQLTQLYTKMNTLDSKLHSEFMDLDQNLQQNFTLQLNYSFGYIYPVYTCGGTGGWRRVVYLDITDPNTNCPSGWQLTSFSKRTCGRVSTSRYTCDLVTFPVSGGDYTRVCGRIIAYQYGHTDAFESYNIGQVTTIEGAYVTGVSLTHGSPRQHIWTFAAGARETLNNNEACPCDTTYNITIPPFVGGDYFCESGVNSGSTSGFHPDDPLWDERNCTATSTCCSFNSPPYFTKQLPSPTTDDIEARICNLDSGSSEDVPIEFIELYVQ